MDKFICTACVFLTGMVVGVAAGVLGMLPKTQVNRQLVDRCRRQMAYIDRLPERDRARFWAQTDGNALLREKWAITAHIAEIQLAE